MNSHLSRLALHMIAVTPLYVSVRTPMPGPVLSYVDAEGAPFTVPITWGAA